MQGGEERPLLVGSFSLADVSSIKYNKLLSDKFPADTSSVFILCCRATCDRWHFNEMRIGPIKSLLLDWAITFGVRKELESATLF